jgi:uncharacterized protein (TIGR03382 family)
MKSQSYGAVGVLSLCLLSTSALASKQGATGLSGKQGANATCVTCHNSGTTAPTVEISGPASLTAGTTGQYEVIIRGGPASVGGTNVAVSNTAAALDPAMNSGLKKMGTELTHSAPKAFASNELRFGFSMTAPSTAGTVTIFGSGNSANNDNTTTGDGVATTKLDVTVTGGTGGGTDAGTGGPDAGTNNPGPGGDDDDKGCSSTGGAPVLFALAAACLGLLRRRQS